MSERRYTIMTTVFISGDPTDTSMSTLILDSRHIKEAFKEACKRSGDPVLKDAARHMSISRVLITPETIR